MQIPLSLWELSLWLAFTSVVLLSTTELISSYYGQAYLLIDKKRLKNVGFALSIIFIIFIALQVAGMVFSLI